MQHYAHTREAPRWGESENRQARMQLRQIGDQLQQREYRYQQAKRYNSLYLPLSSTMQQEGTAVIRRCGGTDRADVDIYTHIHIHDVRA